MGRHNDQSTKKEGFSVELRHIVPIVLAEAIGTMASPIRVWGRNGGEEGYEVTR